MPKPAHTRANTAKQATGKPVRAKPDVANAPKPHGDRVAKVMARAGLCSRRDAEGWIVQGRVTVNGKLLTSPALCIGPDDLICVDGQPLAQRERTRLFLFHKPRGLVTTNKDPEGRATVFDYLKDRHPDLPRLVSVGRLDINTEGLLLLTNDGGLARVLELPTTGWLRRYRVRANGETNQAALDRLRYGVTIEGIHYAGIEATLDRLQGANAWLTIGLREGKNREIKRVLEHLGLFVNRLIRVSFGPFQLGDLAEGAIEEVKTRVLRDQLGASLADAAGVDLTAAVVEPPSQRSEFKPSRPQRSAKPATRANPRPHRAKPEPEPEPAKPRVRPKPGPRKHVSVLRAAEPAEGRQRTIQGETMDRKGRSVAVERRVAAQKPGPRAGSKARDERAGPKTRDERGERPPRRGAKRTTPAGERPRDAAPVGKRPSRAAAPAGKRPPRGSSPANKRPPRGGR